MINFAKICNTDKQATKQSTNFENMSMLPSPKIPNMTKNRLDAILNISLNFENLSELILAIFSKLTSIDLTRF